MVGKGGCLVEAALACPSALCLGADTNPDQLAACAANLHHAALRQVGLLQADAARLPFASGSVDAMVVDLPFGKRHARPKGLEAEVLAEARRVLRPGSGRIVLMTTGKASVHKAVAEDCGWQPVSRTEVVLGGLKVWLHLIRRASNP
jgi:tRNA (guanine6-N2)-methyltransferase